MNVNQIFSNRKNTEEDLRKYFISMALNYKFKFADKLQENVNIEEIYEKVKKLSIPINEWNNFIQKELKLF